MLFSLRSERHDDLGVENAELKLSNRQNGRRGLILIDPPELWCVEYQIVGFEVADHAAQSTDLHNRVAPMLGSTVTQMPA